MALHECRKMAGHKISFDRKFLGKGRIFGMARFLLLECIASFRSDAVQDAQEVKGMRKIKLRRLVTPVIAMVLMFVVNGIVAAETQPATTAITDDLATSTNIMWTLITGFLVFFMQGGFALVETGFTRSKNVAHTMMMNMMVFCIGALGYWLVGFAFQFGGVNFDISRNREDRRHILRPDHASGT